MFIPSKPDFPENFQISSNLSLFREKDATEVILEPKKVCDITEMSVNNLVLHCKVSCEGQVELSGPNSWSSGVKKMADGGGEVEKEIPARCDVDIFQKLKIRGFFRWLVELDLGEMFSVPQFLDSRFLIPEISYD